MWCHCLKKLNQVQSRMIVAPRKPITKDPPTDQANQSTYTLHNVPNKVMAWRIKNEKMKTAVVAFKRPRDAQVMGHMIETHYEREKEWPDFTNPDFSLPAGNPLVPPVDFKILSIREWSNFDSLKVFCAEHFFDLILVNRIINGNRIQGYTYSFETPMEFHSDRLEQLYIWSGLL